MCSLLILLTKYHVIEWGAIDNHGLWTVGFVLFVSMLEW